MGEKRVPIPPVLCVNLCLIVFGLIAFGFAIVGERHSVATFRTDKATNHTYCVYGGKDEVAANSAVGSFFVFNLMECILLGETRFMCSGRRLKRRLAPGRNLVCGKIFLLFSCMTLAIADICLLAAGESHNFWDMFRPQRYSCEPFRKGCFIGASVSIIATIVFNLFYYMHYAKVMNDPRSEIEFEHVSSDDPLFFLKL